MVDSVREALFRLRNSDASGINHRDIYGWDADKDLVVLGRAYLAEHPADEGERLTEVWLQSVGFTVDSPHCNIAGKLTTLHIWLSDSACWVEETNRPGEKVAVQKPQTRGDVRRLCSVLNLPIESKGGGN